jgi:hypothetical protein
MSERDTAGISSWFYTLNEIKIVNENANLPVFASDHKKHNGKRVYKYLIAGYEAMMQHQLKLQPEVSHLCAIFLLSMGLF